MKRADARKAPEPPLSVHRERPGAAVKLRRFPTMAECTMPMTTSPSPCTRVECRYHLLHRSRVGEHRLEPTRECALEVANEGPRTLEQVAHVIGLSHEWVRRLEERALAKLRLHRLMRSLYDLDTE
jgi:hypothetical protein